MGRDGSALVYLAADQMMTTVPVIDADYYMKGPIPVSRARRYDGEKPWRGAMQRRYEALTKPWRDGAMKSSILRRAAVTLLAAVAFGGAARAHHSFNVFDLTVEKVVVGEVVEFEWTNPHTWTWINVTNEDGTVTKWGLEGMSPNFLGRRGWTKSTLQPGDRIEVAIYPLKSGEPGGTFLRATLPDGTLKIMFGRSAE
jgi:hypothetical protein